MALTTFNSLEDLRFWFDRLPAEASKWTLFRGFQTSFNGSSHRIFQQEEDMDKEGSFQLLQEMLERASQKGGKFTVYVPIKTASKGLSTWIELNTTSAKAGINGVNLPALQGYVSIGEVEQRISKERELWEMKREIEDLKAEKEAKLSMGEILASRVTEELDLNMIAGQVLNFCNQWLLKAKGQPVPVSVQGYPQEDPVDYTYDTDQIAPFLDTIRPHFSTDQEFYQFLHQVAQFFQASPEVCKNFFKP